MPLHFSIELFPPFQGINDLVQEKDINVRLLKPIEFSDSDQEHDIGDPDLKFVKKSDSQIKKVHYEGVFVSFSL